VRGLTRELTIFLASGFWALWLWFAMIDERYDWLRLPPIGVPDSAGRMVIMLTTLVYLTLYAVAVSRPHRAGA
jgi:hypothetical protein